MDSEILDVEAVLHSWVHTWGRGSPKEQSSVLISRQRQLFSSVHKNCVRFSLEPEKVGSLCSAATNYVMFKRLLSMRSTKGSDRVESNYRKQAEGIAADAARLSESLKGMAQGQGWPFLIALLDGIPTGKFSFSLKTPSTELREWLHDLTDLQRRAQSAAQFSPLTSQTPMLVDAKYEALADMVDLATGNGLKKHWSFLCNLVSLVALSDPTFTAPTPKDLEKEYAARNRRYRNKARDRQPHSSGKI